VVGLL